MNTRKPLPLSCPRSNPIMRRASFRNEFMNNLARTNRRDPHEAMAEIFNNLDRTSESKFMTALEERSRDSAEKIKSLMFTFEDLGKLENPAIQAILRVA